MKNLIKYGFIAFVICSFSGCTTSEITSKEDKAIEDKKHAERLESAFNVIILDGCEYYQLGNRKIGFMAHKGNCKNPIHNCR